MKESYLWRAVQITWPVSAFFALGFVVGLIGEDYNKAALAFTPIATYFFLVGHVAQVRANSDRASGAFDWFQFACYWVASVSVVIPVLMYLSAH